MKNKLLTYILTVCVVFIWGLICYKIFYPSEAETNFKMSESNRLSDEKILAVQERKPKPLLLNYSDPFGMTVNQNNKYQNKNIRPRKGSKLVTKNKELLPKIVYSGYFKRNNSGQLLTLINIRGEDQILAEGDEREQVRLLKNYKDSIKITFKGKAYYIRLNSVAADN